MEQLDLVGLLRALQKLERNISVSLMYSGLRIPQFRLLDLLAEMGQSTVTEMSQRLRITRASASVLINELIRKGIVAVLENECDRRSFHIRLTELGSNKLHVARNDTAVLSERMSHRFSQEAVALLNEFARTMEGRHSELPTEGATGVNLPMK